MRNKWSGISSCFLSATRGAVTIVARAEQKFRSRPLLSKSQGSTSQIAMSMHKTNGSTAYRSWALYIWLAVWVGVPHGIVVRALAWRSRGRLFKPQPDASWGILGSGWLNSLDVLVQQAVSDHVTACSNPAATEMIHGETPSDWIDLCDCWVWGCLGLSFVLISTSSYTLLLQYQSPVHLTSM